MAEQKLTGWKLIGDWIMIGIAWAIAIIFTVGFLGIFLYFCHLAYVKLFSQ